MAHAYRDDFPLLKSQDVAYLDNAATAQRPQCVLDAVTEFYKSKNANPLRGLYPLSIAATEAYENAREAVRSFLNAKSSREIIFTRNTTESINLVAYSYGLSHVKAGDEVLVSIMEHHRNLLTSQMVCRQIVDLCEMARQPLVADRMVDFLNRSNKLLTMLAEK